MSKHDSDGGDRTGAPVAESRIDPAHVLVKADAEPSRVDREHESPATSKTSSVAEQLRIQAAQLAEYLRARQRNLDHREAQLNAQMARLENDARNTRMLLKERESELAEREQQIEAAPAVASIPTVMDDRQEVRQELARREQAVAQREREVEALAERSQGTSDDLANREEGIRHREKELDDLAEQLAQRDKQLQRDAKSQGVESPDAPGEAASDSSEQDGRIRQTMLSLDSRQKWIEQTEATLRAAKTEADNLRQQLIEDRAKVQEQARTERRRMTRQHRHALTEIEDKRKALARRSEQVDQSSVALEQLRAELGRMHRETLEIRLATEELWVELSGAAPPASLTRSLGQARTRLAEHYRMANAELADAKKELETLRKQLISQHEKLVLKKGEFEQWADGRQDEINRQAERLIAREQELDRQETLFTDLSRQWQSEQLGYQQEIRRLKSRFELDRVPALV